MDTASRPFSNFAKVYDDFMHFVDYDGWVRYIKRLLGYYEIKGKKLLDLACGTGKCSVLFAREGFEVTGIDISKAMLDEAIAKQTTEKFGIKYFCYDMRDFEIEEKTDIVICLYDSLNYIIEKKDLQDVFSCVHNALTDNGIFIFDMNTEYSLKHIWGNNTLRRNEGGIKSIWRNEYDDQFRVATLYLSWQAKEKGKLKEYFEIHKEAAYKNEEIVKMLKDAGFDDAVIYAHGTFMPPTEMTPRIMVAALK